MRSFFVLVIAFLLFTVSDARFYDIPDTYINNTSISLHWSSAFDYSQLLLCNNCTGNEVNTFQQLRASTTDHGSWTGTLALSIPVVSLFCFAVYETGGTSDQPAELNGDSFDIYSKPFDIIYASATSSIAVAVAASSSAVQASRAAMSSYVEQAVNAASSSAAALAYADAHAQEAHDKAVGFGVGLGLAFPVVIAASVGMTLLFCVRRHVAEDNALTTRSFENSSVMYRRVGIEQQPAMGIEEDESTGRVKVGRLSGIAIKLRASV